MNSLAFQAYALVSAVLALQLMFLGFWTGLTRGRRRDFAVPEDAQIARVSFAAGDHPDTVRALRAHANALENALPFFLLGALYVAAGGTATGTRAYCYTFLAARLLHSVFYIGGIQPFRTLAYLVGVLAMLGMALHVIRAVV